MTNKDKYRGRAINRKDTWFYGDLRHGKNGEVWIFPLDQEPGIDKHRVDPATVGQYRKPGSKDDIECYDGDRIENQDGVIGTVFYDEEHYKLSVRWDSPVYCSYRDSSEKVHDFYQWSDTFDVKVIGNVHDNPESLEAT